MADAVPAGNVIAVRLRVHGKVQGVGYRAWCVTTAQRLTLKGWVRNLKDGTVEVIAAGAESAINKLLSAVNTGPPHCQVSEVHISVLDLTDKAVTALTAGFIQK